MRNSESNGSRSVNEENNTQNSTQSSTQNGIQSGAKSTQQVRSLKPADKLAEGGKWLRAAGLKK